MRLNLFRWTMRLLSLTLFTLPPLSWAQDADASPVECAINPNHVETYDEFSFTLLRILSLASAPNSPLDRADVAADYHSTLVSMRRYLEGLDVPDCAQELNTSFVHTISAAQDAVTLRMLRTVLPERSRLDRDLQTAITRLGEHWQQLSRTQDTLSFVPQP